MAKALDVESTTLSSSRPTSRPAQPPTTVGPTTTTLHLGVHELSIVGDQLSVWDRSPERQRGRNKRNRACGFIPVPSFDKSSSPSSAAETPTAQIPLYNILWAECADDALTIDYAEDVSKTRLQAAKLTISFAPPRRPPPSHPTPPLQASGDATDLVDLEMGQGAAARHDAQVSSASASASAPGSAAAKASAAAFAAALLDASYEPTAKRRKRAYVLINPSAGPGGAVGKFEAEVRPIFAAARMELEVHVTSRGGEGSELAERMDVDRFDAVVACSGDGLPYEVFNGLGRRRDGRRALASVAVVHIPCGSGNAMACNLYGTHHPAQAALAAVKGVPTPMDLVSVSQGATRTLSFLSQALGVVAEADLATEDLRWMGSARFTYGFLARLIKRAVYPCDISVKVEIDDKTEMKTHYSRHRANGSAEALTSSSTAGSNANSIRDGAESSSRSGGGGGGGGGGSADDGEGLPPLRWGTINDKVPDGWETISYDNMGNFYCGNMAYMMPDSDFFSAACINDGLMDLVTIDGDINPLKSIRLMLAVESGHFFDDPLVKYRKVSAYRVTPRNQESGYISVDGERVPFEPFQCEVHQGLGLVLSRSGRYEAPGPRNWDKVTTSERLIA